MPSVLNSRPNTEDIKPQFRRNSTAIKTTPDDLIEFALNEPVTHQCMMASVPSSVEAVTDPVDIRIGYQHTEETLILGFISSGDDVGIYSLESGSWVKLNSESGVEALWVLNDGETILFVESSNSPRTMKRFTYDGETASTPTSVLTFSSTTVSVLGQSNLRQNAAGTIMFGEYAPNGTSAGNNCNLYFSTDNGLTFTSYHEQADGHCHTVSFHEGQQKWVAVFGDGNYRAALISDDDGTSGTTTFSAIPQHSVGYDHIQPVGLLDTGDSTRLLCGSDNAWQLFWLDILTGDVTSIISFLPYVLDESFFFHIDKLGDYYVLAHQDNESTSSGKSEVWITKDFNSFACVYRLSEGWTAAQLGGVLAGKWVLGIQQKGATAYKLLQLSPPDVIYLNSVELSGASSNLLSEAEATFSSGKPTGYWSDGTESVVAEGRGGRDAYKAAETNNSNLTVTYDIPAGSITPVDGKYYALRFGFKAVGEYSAIECRLNFDNSTAKRTMDAIYLPAKGGWIDALIPIQVSEADDTNLELLLKLWGNQDATRTILIDYIQVVEGTSSFAANAPFHSSDKAADVLKYDIGAGDAFTHLLTIRPCDASDDMVGTQLIRSYVIDDNNFVNLVFDPATQTVELQPTVAGVAGTEGAADLEFFNRETDIQIAVQADGTDWNLWIANGKPFSAIETTTGPDVTDSTVTVTTRNGASNLLWHKLLVDSIYHYSMSVTDFPTAMLNSGKTSSPSMLTYPLILSNN